MSVAEKSAEILATLYRELLRIEEIEEEIQKFLSTEIDISKLEKINPKTAVYLIEPPIDNNVKALEIKPFPDFVLIRIIPANIVINLPIPINGRAQVRSITAFLSKVETHKDLLREVLEKIWSRIDRDNKPFFEFLRKVIDIVDDQ